MPYINNFTIDFVFQNLSLGCDKFFIPDEILMMQNKLTFVHSFEIHDPVLGVILIRNKNSHALHINQHF